MEKIKLLIRGFGSVLFFSALLFICAGKLNYFQGWIYLSTCIITTIITFIATHNNNELLKERSQAGQGRSWDKLLLGISAIIFVITIVISGFDSGRFQWSPKLNWGFYLLGILITILGHSIFVAAQRQNNFFSAAFRIQADRGHTVCKTGVYKIVRHPGYLGMTVSLVGLPLLTGSILSFAPTSIAIIILFVRTNIEDKTLKNELNGYIEYTKQTRYKILPYVW